MYAQAKGGPGHAKNSGDHFLERFDAKSFEQHLKERGDRTQQHTIEFSFDDVVVAEVVEIKADDVEQTIGDLCEAPEEDDFFQPPAGQLRGFLKQDDDEAERENRCGHAGGYADEEIGAV